MEQEELNKILEEHKKWIDNEPNGKRADLRGANLCDANLRSANLCNADLCDADLRDANLRSANLCDADLCNANLRNADLCNTDLRSVNLCNANLYSANLCDADLRGADLRGANLCDADLCNANLRNADLPPKELLRKGIIVKRKMTGWKKCRNGVIVKLEIPKGAIVFSINNNKCRTNIAKVVEICGTDKKQAISNYDSNFIYELGKTMKVDDFDLMYNVECSTGIHFLKTRKEAEQYA